MADSSSRTSTPRRAPVNRRQFMRVAGASSVGVAMAEVIAPGRAASDQSPATVQDFIRTVKDARLFDLSLPWDEESPLASVNPSYSMTLERTHDNTIGQFDGHLSFTAEVQHWSGQHGAPSIDAIGHIGRDGKLFGGVDASAATRDPRGIGRSGVGAHLDIAHYSTDLLVNRGVLLDVARLVKGDATAPLGAGFEITAQHLAKAAAAQKVTLARGDTVLIRTGWGQFFAGNPDRYKGDASPGPGVEGAQFLVDHGARVVGNDTLTFEKRPPVLGTPGTPSFRLFPVHMLLIADHGIHIIENFFLEEIAAAQAYEFLVVVPPLKIRGGTGSALRAFALVPNRPGG